MWTASQLTPRRPQRLRLLSPQDAGPHKQAFGLVQVPLLERGDGAYVGGTAVLRENHIRQCDCSE